MMTTFKKYIKLLEDLRKIRKRIVKVNEEEDNLLDKMDDVWLELTGKEQKKINDMRCE